MDWRDEESDYATENFMWDRRHTLTKTTSVVTLADVEGRNVRNQGVQVAFDNSEEIRNFSSAFECLGLEGDGNYRNTHPDCVDKCEDDETVTGFRTRELSTLRLVIQSPDILNFQGTRQAPEDIARYWKKDSRMWLWKSVRLARKRGKQKSANLLHSINPQQKS